MKTRRSFGLVPALLLVVLAGSRAASPEPTVADKPYYLSASDVSTIHVGPPPPLGSPEDVEGMKAVKAAQIERTAEDCARALAGAYPAAPAFDDFFGPISPFPTPLSGQPREVIIRVWSDLSLVSEGIKKKYKWPRPYAVDSTLEPCVKKTSNPAFPSGHAATSRVFALLLADLSPEKREAYLERADQIARDRLLAGMHRPSEVEAGKALADQIYAGLLKSRAFRRDLARLRKLVKK